MNVDPTLLLGIFKVIYLKFFKENKNLYQFSQKKTFSKILAKMSGFGVGLITHQYLPRYHRQLKIVLGLALEDFLFSVKVDVLDTLAENRISSKESY